MHARFDLVALETGRDGLAYPHRDCPAAMHEAPAPDDSAVERDRNNGEPKRTVKTGKAWPQGRRIADANPGAFWEDDHGPARLDRGFASRHHLPEGFRSRASL